MTDPQATHKDLIGEIINRRKLGENKYHSETSLQNLNENEMENVSHITKDPGVLNLSLNDVLNQENSLGRRRTVSQPGPTSGSLQTATAARAARRRPLRSVMYAPEIERNEFATRAIKDDEGSFGTPVGDRNSPNPLFFNGNIRSNGDLKSLNNYRIYLANDMRGGTTPRKRSVTTMDAQSLRSVETQAPPPTNPEDNKRLTAKYMALILSGIYAILLITLGLLIYLGDIFVQTAIGSIYSIILTVIGFGYLLYLLFDINRYKSVMLKNKKIKELHQERISEYCRKREEFGTIGSDDRTPESYRSIAMPPASLIPLNHDYCFSQGRHSGSFYLKMGAAGFALGHLVHSVLLITLQIKYFIDEDINNQDCIDIFQLVLDVLNPIYSFMQLYFIFKYSNVIILRGQGLAYFGFMHMIGSSLCFWISTIVRETILALTLYANSKYGNSTYANETRLNDVTEINAKTRIFDVSNLYDEHCQSSASIISVFENLSPYLYPFSVEFNIFIVAVYYIIWKNIGNCNNDADNIETDSSLDENNSSCKIPTASAENDFTSNMVIYADCHASNRGLFVGLVLIVILIGMLIIGFVFSSVGENYLEMGYLLNDCTKLFMHVVMLIAAVIAYNQTIKLDINEHPISLLDDVLLFVCLPAFFMEVVLSMVATISLHNIVKTVDLAVMFIQVIIQTTLLVDGLRRCSNSRKLRRKKPGRELHMFLIIANVAMWLFNTFSYKSPDRLDERYEYYGKVLWSILGHISLPLIMFYRFHSSVCFADIWGSAYKPGSEH
ncbi:unnamed protein product [Parnassius mnemosyne]|uniref:Otopetrin-2 n=1 Tax=Parnassius mnemosyne TaxID=213953 RepID=A0AAV1K7C7_9NEOP